MDLWFFAGLQTLPRSRTCLALCGQTDHQSLAKLRNRLILEQKVSSRYEFKFSTPISTRFYGVLLQTPTTLGLPAGWPDSHARSSAARGPPGGANAHGPARSLPGESWSFGDHGISSWQKKRWWFGVENMVRLNGLRQIEGFLVNSSSFYR